MTLRIRVDGVTREETGLDVDFPGRAELRQKIGKARAAGDTEMLRELQRQHREMRLASIGQGGGSSRTAAGRPAAVPTVLRTPISAESTLPLDPEREITGYLLTWGESLTSTRADGEGSAIWLNVQPSDVREWLAGVDPAKLPVKADHMAEVVSARWHRFEMDAVGLSTTAEVERTPGGDLLMEAIDSGAAGGLSFQGDVSNCHDTHNTREGRRVFRGGPIFILEGSVVVQPADSRCEFVTIAGRQPMWIQHREAVERDRAVARMWGLS